jgi:ABC-2 type transport system ATP-binding protein
MTTDESAVQLTGLVKRFGSVPAVAGLDLTVSAGEIVALLGPNGAGKSTTISMLLGLIRADAGSVALFGEPAVEAVRAGRVGAMLQECQLPWFATVGELIALARSVYPRPLPTAEILAAAGLEGLVGRRLEKLSSGQAQRARFGFALAGGPDLLVLDESTAGMDVAARMGFWDVVRRRAEAGSAVLFATHQLAEADEFADRVVVVAAGRVVADGSSAEIKRAAENRRISFRLPGASADGLARLPGVRRVEVRGERVVLTSEDADTTVQALFQAHTNGVRDLEVTGAGLTEAFLALTADPGDDAEGCA